jgi:RNA polymerase sigma factor (sigma-70 family)
MTRSNPDAPTAPRPTTPRTPQPAPHTSRPGPRAGGRHGSTPEASFWAELVALRPRVLAFLRRRCRDEHQAEDLTQETLLRAARHGAHFHRIERPLSWALQVAANVHLDHTRKESWQHLSPPEHPAFLLIPGTEIVPGEVSDPELYRVEGVEVDGEDLSLAVREVWPRLLERDRIVLSAFYAEGGSTASAADACGVDRDLVKVRLFRARRRLHAAVVEHLGRHALAR